MTGDYCQKCGNYVTTLLTHDCSTHEPCPTCAALRADKRRLSDTVAAQVAEMAELRAEVERLKEAVEWALNEGGATAQNEGWDAYEAELRCKVKEGK